MSNPALYIGNVQVSNFPTSQTVSGTVNIAGTTGSSINANNNCMNVGLYDSLGAPFTQAHSAGALDVNIATISFGPLNIADSAGDTLNALGGSLQIAVFDGSGDNPISSTAGNLNVQTQSGLALDSSIQTLINQSLNNGGTLWSATVVSDSDFSTAIDLTSKQVVTASFFGNVACNIADTPTITIYYSADNTTFYESQNTMQGLNAGGGDFSLDCISNAHFIRAKITGLLTGGAGSGTITMYLNCANP